MIADLTRLADLSNTELNGWAGLQRSTPFFDSPFYSPEFAQAVHRVRGDVEVATLREGGQCMGFFPFHRNRWNMGTPVGKHLNDFQGVIAGDGATWDARDLISGCGLRSWYFNHLPSSQAPFQPSRWRLAESPFIDLSRGFEAYEQERHSAGSCIFTQTHRKSRKMGREVGPLRFVWDISDRWVLETLLRWKREQRARAGMSDPFSPWVVNLLDDVRKTRGQAFSGLMSALYAGDHLVAIHLGLLGDSVAHVWFPVYNRTYARYSPGLVLLMYLAQACASRGILRMDLGKGDERYKRRLMTGSVQLAEGWVGSGVAAGVFPGAWYRARRMVQSGPLSRPYRFAKRTLLDLRYRAVTRSPGHGRR